MLLTFCIAAVILVVDVVAVIADAAVVVVAVAAVCRSLFVVGKNRLQSIIARSVKISEIERNFLFCSKTVSTIFDSRSSSSELRFMQIYYFHSFRNLTLVTIEA